MIVTKNVWVRTYGGNFAGSHIKGIPLCLSVKALS